MFKLKVGAENSTPEVYYPRLPILLQSPPGFPRSKRVSLKFHFGESRGIILRGFSPDSRPVAESARFPHDG